MDRETKKWLALVSIIVVVAVILLLLLAGFDLSGFEIRSGIKIN